MINAVKKFIEENNLEGKKILIGLSGGVDSSVLCDILSKINNIEVIAIHLNHNWRGENSKNDESFSKKFAAKRGLEFYAETLDENLKKTETAARELRYNFFEKCKEKFGADGVFLAHNKNDNVETLLYRLIKGTGPAGLSSIPKIRDFYYRPLLDFSREEIENYAKKNELEFVVDCSNFDTKYKRNLIRQEILPKMKEINGEVMSAISSFIKVNKMNQNIVEAVINDALDEIQTQEGLILSKFLSKREEIQYEIINRFLKGILKNRDFKTIDKIVKFIQKNSSSKISVGKNIFLKVYDDKIYISKKREETFEEIELKEGKNKFLNYTLTLEETETPETFPNYASSVQYLNLDLEKKYKIRTRKEGDKIQPFGQKEVQKLKSYLINKKIPEELRGKLPLIALEDEILLVPFYTVSEKVRVDKKQKICYKLTIKKDL